MPTDRETHKFTHVYDFDYYAGSQVGIFIGDVFVDDISAIGYDLIQKKVPIYGYASSHFDRMAAGTVIVEGQFSINFKERGYMFVILERYNRLLNSSNNPNGSEPRTNDQADLALRKNIERLVTESEAHPNFDFDTNDLRFLSELNELSDEQFGRVAGVFEDVAWGDQGIDIPQRQKGRNLKPGESIPSDSFGSQLIRPDQFPGFNIVIGYGDVFKNQKSNSNRTRQSQNSTTKTIYDVHLTGERQLVEANGEPIQEIYSFLAKNVL